MKSRIHCHSPSMMNDFQVCILLLVQFLTACSIDPTQSVSRTATAASTPMMVPTPIASTTPASTSANKFNGPWRTYSDDALGITFEYPAPFDAGASLYACGIRPSNNQVAFGVAQLTVLPADRLSLEEYVNQYVQKTDRPPWFRVTRRQVVQARNTTGIALSSYDSGLLYTLLDTFFIRGTYIYHFHTPAYRSFARFCDDDTIGLFHVDVYEHAIASFEFTKPAANVTIVFPTPTPTFTPEIYPAATSSPTNWWTPIFTATAAMSDTLSALFDPHHHVVNMNGVGLLSEVEQEFAFVEIALASGVAPYEIATNSTQTWQAFFIDEPNGTNTFRQKFVVQNLKTRKTYEIQGLPLPWRPISDLVWVTEDILVFDRWFQPHYGIHYALNVRTRRLVLALPFPDRLP